MKKKYFLGVFFLFIAGLSGFYALQYWTVAHKKETNLVQEMESSHLSQLAEIKISKVNNIYPQEKSGNDWWYWVNNEIIFQLDPSNVSSEMKKTRLHFEYGVHGDQQLTVYLWERDKAHKIVIHTTSGERTVYDKVLDISPALLTKLTIVTNGVARPLSNTDSRLASYTISNLKLNPV